MRGGNPDDLLWNRARIVFELRAPGGRSVRSIQLRRPHALIGRIVGADIPIADTGVGARHAYLHADDRGVYLIDLASRGGTRVNGAPISSTWLRIGDIVEIAGREIELKEVHINGFLVDSLACDDRLLADSSDDRLLVGLSLEPQDRRGASWVVGSELVFIGRDESCGIRIDGDQIAKTHCALLKSSSNAYIIDLLVQRTSVNNQHVRGAAALADGDLLEIGRERFLVRIEPFSGEQTSLWNATNRQDATIEGAPSTNLVRILGDLPGPADGQPFPLDSIPADAQSSVLAWMLGALQTSHGELIRRQNDLQTAMGEALRQVQEDSTQALDQHVERIESLNRELIELKKIVGDREGPFRPTAPPLLRNPSRPTTPVDAPPRPSVSPPPPSRPAHQASTELIPSAKQPGHPIGIGQALPQASTESIPSAQPAAAGPEIELPPVSERSRETTAWLLNRIDQLDDKKKFSIKRMFGFGRSGSNPYAPSPVDDELAPSPPEIDDLDNGPGSLP